MQQTTKTVQFLIIGTNQLGKEFEERQNFKFPPTAKPEDVTHKRNELTLEFQKKGCTVSIYTVSPQFFKS